MLPKSSETGEGKNRTFGQITIGWPAWYDSQNFHLIMIAAPLHVSESSRVVKSQYVVGFRVVPSECWVIWFSAQRHKHNRKL
jgi:hypothetical protein